VKRWAIAFAAIAAVFIPGVASAHPLGNFTVNHYARLDAQPDGLRIEYVLDEAEIPTFQDKPAYAADPDGFADDRAAAIAANLHVTLNGQALPLHVDSRSLTFADGAGGLPTLRLEATFSAAYPQVSQATALEVRDDNDPTRIGWRELVASGPALQRSSVPATDVSNALRQYPDDLLNSPLNVREATLTIAPSASNTSGVITRSASDVPGVITRSASDVSGVITSGALSAVSAPGANPVLERARTAFADLANADELTPAFIVFAVAVALVLGAAHALQPGHGKTVVAAYLVGSRGTARHAAFLGATVTATHTAGVYALGLVTLLLSQYIVPERLYPILEAASGLLVLAIGVWLLGQRLLSAVRPRRAQHHHHDHHDHAHEPPVGWRSLLALGVSGGLLPCPEALMVLLITIAAHRVLFGLLLIVSFSTGLAAVLVGFGLLLVYARTAFQRLNISSTSLMPRLLPVASALVIVLAGGLITAQALPQVL
jgi:nickel/cobalt transporter (NicO) family protein